jgi:hypothetical protein
MLNTLESTGGLVVASQNVGAVIRVERPAPRSEHPAAKSLPHDSWGYEMRTAWRGEIRAGRDCEVRGRIVAARGSGQRGNGSAVESGVLAMQPGLAVIARGGRAVQGLPTDSAAKFCAVNVGSRS